MMTRSCVILAIAPPDRTLCHNEDAWDQGIGMDRRWWLGLGIVLLGILLSGFTLPLQGLRPYSDRLGGYEFFYPGSWDQAQVPLGVAVAFQERGRPSENVSLVIGEAQADRHLQDLGSPAEVGRILIQQMIAPMGAARQAELISAESQTIEGKSYYILEIAVQLPASQNSFLDGSTIERHNLASLAIDRGKIYTFNLSVSQERWSQDRDLFYSVVNSFRVF